MKPATSKAISVWVAWIVGNGLFAAALCMGVLGHHQGLANVALFSSWATAVLSLSYLWNGNHIRIRVPAKVDLWFDIICITLMVWHGWLWTGAAYTVQAAIVQCAIEDALRKPKEEKKEKKEAENG